MNAFINFGERWILDKNTGELTCEPVEWQKLDIGTKFVYRFHYGPGMVAEMDESSIGRVRRRNCDIFYTNTGMRGFARECFFFYFKRSYLKKVEHLKHISRIMEVLINDAEVPTCELEYEN